MTSATFSHQPQRPQVTQLRLGRVVLLIGAAGLLLFGGAAWLLQSKVRSVADLATDSTAWPAWLKQAQTYPVPDAPPPAPPKAVVPDPTAAELAALRAQLEEQRRALEALQRRPMTPPTAQPQKAPHPPAQKAASPMLFVAHEPKEQPEPTHGPTYTLAPGATKLLCQVETAINSDVEGYFTAKVSTNVYDTATGRHLLVPQGSTILGQTQSSTLLYGNERLPTVSMTLALPDGRSVDLGQAPVIDQQGVAGLTGKVNQHWWRLVGAVFIGGALRGGTQMIQTEIARSAPGGPIIGGIAQSGTQATQQRLGRALDTRPTIAVASGQLCHVLLIKPLTLPAMWQ